MANGRVDIRVTQRDGKARLRFYGINPEQLVLVKLALEKAREEMETDFDSVAFEAVCLYFLMHHKPTAKLKEAMQIGGIQSS